MYPCMFNAKCDNVHCIWMDTETQNTELSWIALVLHLAVGGLGDTGVSLQLVSTNDHLCMSCPMTCLTTCPMTLWT